MKIKHLFTFFIILTLTSSGTLLTEMSSIAQGPKSEGKTTPPPEIPATSSSPDISTPSATPAASSAVKGVSKTDSDDASPLPLILGGLSGLLHLLEIAGLVWAYLKIQQLTEESRDSRSQIKSLIERLSVSEQKQKAQGDQLKMIGSEVANAGNLISRMNAIEQAAQRKPHDSSYADPAYALPSPGVAKATTAPSLYSFLDTYRRSSDNFKNQYNPKIVSEDADNLQKRWSGDQQEIILREERQGNYWLFNEERLIYLIPNPKLKVIDQNMRTVGSLFNCENYAPGLTMTVVSPAIVSMQPGTSNRWKLEQKGTLEFN